MIQLFNHHSRIIWLVCIGFFCIINSAFSQTIYKIERTLNVKQAYGFTSELGIKANASGSEAKVEIRMYAKDYYTTGGREDKNSFLYGVFTNWVINNSTSYIAKGWEIEVSCSSWLLYIPFINELYKWRCSLQSNLAFESDNYKDRVIQVSRSLSHSIATHYGFSYENASQFQVIIELEVSGSATLNDVTSVKLPGVGEISGLEFRDLPPGHACIGVNSVECNTLREFRYGDFEKAIITAHRGFWGYGDIPEVTMNGLENAYNHGYISVEIDILQTKDNELVLMHDQAVNRMTSLPETYEGCFNDNTNSNSFQSGLVEKSQL